jgi:hypothetical protein
MDGLHRSRSLSTTHRYSGKARRLASVSALIGIRCSKSLDIYICIFSVFAQVDVFCLE